MGLRPQPKACRPLPLSRLGQEIGPQRVKPKCRWRGPLPAALTLFSRSGCAQSFFLFLVPWCFLAEQGGHPKIWMPALPGLVWLVGVDGHRERGIRRCSCWVTAVDAIAV